MSITRTLAFGSLAALVGGALPSGAVAMAADRLPKLATPPSADARETPPPIPASAQPEAVWYVVIDGAQVGPLTEDGVMRRLDRGEISSGTLIWRAGMAQWQTIADTQPIMAKRVAAAIRDWKPPTPLDEKFSPLI